MSVLASELCHVAKKRKQKRQRTRVPAGVEDSRAEVITVAWMLAMMTTLGAELVGGLLRLALSRFESAATSPVALANLMLFSAAVTGLFCLSLTPLVYRFRRVPPPTAVTVLAVTVSILPLAIGAARSLR
jgi:hypothetical protein